MIRSLPFHVPWLSYTPTPVFYCNATFYSMAWIPLEGLAAASMILSYAHCTVNLTGWSKRKGSSNSQHNPIGLYQFDKHLILPLEWQFSNPKKRFLLISYAFSVQSQLQPQDSAQSELLLHFPSRWVVTPQNQKKEAICYIWKEI